MANRGQWILVLVIVTVLGGALVAGMTLSPSFAPVGPESRAPDFAVVDLASLDTVTLRDYKGEVILLNIWATWCIPCETEMPSIQRLHEELAPEGLRVIAISVDNAGPERVLEWVNERGLTFDILHDQAGNIERTYQTIGVPETFVIDRQGIIVKKVIGATEWDHPVQKALLRELLSGDAAQD